MKKKKQLFLQVILLVFFSLSFSLPGLRAEQDQKKAEDLLDRLAAHQAYRYFYVPPESSSEAGTPDQKPKSQTLQKKKPVDPDITQKAYTGESGENIGGKSPQRIFDDFMKEVVGRSRQGSEILRSMDSGEWKDKLIRATVSTLHSNGANSPAAIKRLVEEGRIPKDHARLMWYARDILVREAAGKSLAALRRKYNGYHFDLTILDSGSYGSITSDIDKTVHLTARDKNGKPVPVHGPGGLMNHDDLVKHVVEHFNETAKTYGASEPNDSKKRTAHIFLDTEFFSTDTLPENFAKGRTYKTVAGELPLAEALSARKKHFKALQRNPGPSYQFSGTVFSQVTGRAIEAQAGLQHRIDTRLERMKGQRPSALAWEEALVFSHSACRQFSTGEDGRVRVMEMDVAEFLEKNNLVYQYSRAQAAENAAGNFEKLIHKTGAVFRADGSFDPAAWSAKKNDIAKYHDRGGSKDTGTARNPDPDPPKGMGNVRRRYGPSGAKKRFGKVKPFSRPYTRSVHNDLFSESLQKLYASAPDAYQRVQQDLDLFWRATQVSENILALKEDPELPEKMPRKWAPAPGEAYPESRVLRPLSHYLKQKYPDRFGNLSDNDPQLLTQAKKLHVKTAERQTVVAAGGELAEALNLWLLPQHNKVKAIIAAQGNALGLKKRERFRLKRSGRTDAETMKRIAALDVEIKEKTATLNEMRRNPRGIEADIYMAGMETARRTFLLFGQPGTDKAYNQMMDLLPSRQREAVQIMEAVWKAQASEAKKEKYRKQLGLEPLNVKKLGRQAVSNLALGYMESFGVDPDAYFRRVPPNVSVRANSASKVLRRFFTSNYVNYGLFDSAGRMIRTMQMSENLPWEERMTMLSETMGNEFVMGVPIVGPLWTTSQGVKAGDPKVAAGGVISLGSEMAQVCLARASTASSAAQIGSMGALVVNLARTGVEIVGHEAFTPVRDHFLQLVTKGYVGRQSSGLIRAGTRKIDDRLPVTPIMATPAETSGHAFLYLDPEQAQQLSEDFLAAGQARAAKAIYEWSLGENKLGQDWREGVPISSPVMIDLATDFNRLIADIQTMPPGNPNDPQSLIDRLQLSRSVVIDLLKGHSALQQAVKDRIRLDSKKRESRPEELNLWYLAARQNLGLHLDKNFDREVRLLAAALGGWKKESAPLIQDREKILDRHRKIADSEFTKHLQAELDAVLDTPKIYRSRIEAMQDAPGMAETIYNWSNPNKLLSDYISDNLQSWWSGSKKVGEKEIQFRRLASAVAFRARGFIDDRKELAEEIQFLRQKEYELLSSETRDAKKLKTCQQERQKLVLQYNLLDQGFQQAESFVAAKVAHLRLMDWLDGTGAFDNDVHAAVKFLWHDAEVQKMVRDQVTADLTMSRQLARQYRAFTSVYRALLEAELNSERTEYARATDYAIQQEQRQAAQRYLELRALARERGQVFDGNMRMEVVPNLVLIRKPGTEPQLKVCAEIAVSHDTLRAASVDIEQGVHLVAPEDVEKVFGSQALGRALALTGLKKEEIAFAARIDARVKKAVPEKGFDAFRYTSLPATEGHMLLFPGPSDKSENTPAEKLVLVSVTSKDEEIDMLGEQLKGEVNADPFDSSKNTETAWAFDYAIKAPLEIDLGDDFSIGLCAGAAIRNLAGPGGQRIDLSSSIDTVSGDYQSLDKSRNKTYHVGNLIDISKKNGEETSGVINPKITFTLDHQNSRPPNYFHYISEAGHQLDILTGQRPENLPDRPVGDFVAVRMTVSFGGQDDVTFHHENREYILTYRPLRENEQPPVFKRPDFADTDTCTPPETQMSSLAGKTPVLKLVEISGIYVDGGFDHNAEYKKGDTGFILSSKKYMSRHRGSWKGFLRVKKAPSEIILGEPFEFTAEIKMKRVYEKNEYCFRKENGKIFWGGDLGETAHTDPGYLSPRLRFNVSGSGGTQASSRQDLHPYCSSNDASGNNGKKLGHRVEKDGEVDLKITFLPDRVEEEYGVTKTRRKFHYNITYQTQGDLLSYVENGSPVKKSHVISFDKKIDKNGDLFPDEEPYSIAGAPLSVSFGWKDKLARIIFVYNAISKGQPYIKNVPVFSPPADILAPSGGNTGTGDAGSGSDTVSDSQEEQTGIRQEDAGTSGRQGSDERIDPEKLNPNNQKTGSLIREWIQVAEPPENVTEGASLRYEKWGRKIGTTADGVTVTATAKPDFALSTPEETVWSARKELDSVHHCTVEEYVLARLENRSIEKCRGRFKTPETVAVEKLTGLTVPDAKKKLVDAGLKPRLIAGKPAPSREKEGTVVSQDPGPGTELKPGNSVEIQVYGPYNPKVVVPDVTGLEVKKAQAKLKSEGLKVRLVASGPAPSNELSLKIRESEPKKGTRVSPGTEVMVKVYGKYSPPLVTVPDLQGLSFSEAKNRLARVGLKVSPRSAGTAPSEDKASRVKSQQPGAGTKVNPDSLVKVYVFSKYIPPIPPVHEGGIGQQEETTAGAWKLVGRTGPKVTSQPGCRKPVFQGSTVHYLTEPDYGYWNFSFSWQEPPKVIVPDKEYSLSITSMAKRRGTPTGEAGVGARIGIGVKGIRSSILKCFANGDEAKPDYFAWSGFQGSVNGVAKILLEPNDPDQFKIRLWITDGGCSFALIGEYTYQREKRVSLVQVPDVKGLSFAEASRWIRQKGLKVKPVAAGSAPSQQTSEKIAGTQPAAGQKVASGDSITIHVYSKYIPETGGGEISHSGSGSQRQFGSCNDFMGTWEFNLGFDQYRVHVCPGKRQFKDWGNKIQLLYARDKQSNRIKKAGYWYCRETDGKPDMTFYWYDWGGEKWEHLGIKDNRLIGKISDTNDQISGRKIGNQANCRGSTGMDSDCDLVGSFESSSFVVKFSTRDGVNFAGKVVRCTNNTYRSLHPVGSTWFTLERQHVNPLGGSTYVGKEYDAKGRLYRNVVVIAGCRGINVNKRGENQGGLWKRVD